MFRNRLYRNAPLASRLSVAVTDDKPQMASSRSVVSFIEPARLKRTCSAPSLPSEADEAQAPSACFIARLADLS